jgi:hypothetical protein
VHGEIEASLSYIVRPYVENKKIKEKRNKNKCILKYPISPL